MLITVYRAIISGLSLTKIKERLNVHWNAIDFHYNIKRSPLLNNCKLQFSTQEIQEDPVHHCIDSGTLIHTYTYIHIYKFV